MDVFVEPPAMASQVNPGIVLGVFGVVVVLALAAALYYTVRDRDPIPLLACFGAFVCALNEPIYDILGMIVYANNHLMAYSAFGRDIPWFLVIGYIPWVGFLPYLVARWMAKGVPRRYLHWLALGSCVSVVVVETLGNSYGAWTYYGSAPLKYLVVAPQLAPVPIVGGFLLYAIAFPLAGWKRGLAAFVISTLALPMVFASVSWPLYFGLYTSFPIAIDYLLGAAMLAFSAAAVVCATGLAERLRANQE